jgi:nucleotide-binding universal stress UspA family protein
MKKILVPVDGSPESKKAAEEAVSMAKKYGAEIAFVTVAEVESEAAYTEFGISLSGEYVDLRDTLLNIKIENGKKMLTSMLEKLDLTGVKTEKTVVAGSAHNVIIETAESGKFDLIVMGHRGLNPVKRFFMGSVAKRVIEDAPCSVMVIK